MCYSSSDSNSRSRSSSNRDRNSRGGSGGDWNTLSVESVTPSTSLAPHVGVTTVTDFNTTGVPGEALGEALECQPVG